MVKAVLFDMDGVLIDSFEAWFRVFNSARKKFGSKPITKKEFVENLWAVDSSVSIHKYFPGKEINEVVDFYFENFMEFKDHIKLIDGARPLLEELKKKKIKLGVVTNTYHEQTEMILKAVKLFDFFDTIVCPDDAGAGKPHPDMLFKACKNLKIEKEQAIFIGDTSMDIKAGKNASIFTIGFNVNGGNKKVKDLKEVLLLID